MSFDLTNKNIQDTFQNLLQKTGSDGRLYDLEGNQVRDLVIDGTLTANTYITSESITHTSSGSTAFGNSSDDSHTFQGHITASGNISASGTVISNGVNTLGITLPASTTAIVGNSDEDYLTFSANNKVEIGDPGGAANGLNFVIDDANSVANLEVGKLGVNLPPGTTSIPKTLTVAGDISASGDIIASTISASTLTNLTTFTAAGNLDIGSHNFRALDIIADGGDLNVGDADEFGILIKNHTQGSLSIGQGDDASVKYIDIDSARVLIFSSLHVTGSITASGNISASGNGSFGGSVQADAQAGFHWGDSTTAIYSDNPNSISIKANDEDIFKIGTYGVNVPFGNVTASGDISASGTITSDAFVATAGVRPATDGNVYLGTTGQRWSMIHTDGIKVQGDISQSGNFITEGNITASGNISSSGIVNANQ